jgi:hypothetical protein
MKSGIPFSRVLAAWHKKRMRGSLLATGFLLLGVVVRSSQVLPHYQGARNVVQSARTYPPLSKRNDFFRRNLGKRRQRYVGFDASMSVSETQKQTFRQRLDLAYEEG